MVVAFAAAPAAEALEVGVPDRADSVVAVVGDSVAPGKVDSAVGPEVSVAAPVLGLEDQAGAARADLAAPAASEVARVLARVVSVVAAKADSALAVEVMREVVVGQVALQHRPNPRHRVHAVSAIRRAPVMRTVPRASGQMAVRGMEAVVAGPTPPRMAAPSTTRGPQLVVRRAAGSAVDAMWVECR